MKLLLAMSVVLMLLAGCSRVEKALSCPEGTSLQVAYYMPIPHTEPGGTVWIQMMPIYECES